MTYIVMLDGKFTANGLLSKDEALRVARDEASKGAVAQVYKLVETHYFAANFHKMAPG